MILERWGVPLAVAMDVKHVEFAAQATGADVIVSHQLCHAAVIAHERLSIPLAVLGFSAYLWPHGVEEGEIAQTRDRRAWRLRESVHLHNDMRKLFGLSPTEATPEDNPLHGDVFMVRSIPELEYERGSTLPPKVRLVGACQWEPPIDTGELWTDIARSIDYERQTIVYVQHGRTFRSPNFWRPLVAAFADSNVALVASLGRMDGEIGRLPANVYARPHVPQGAILPRAQAVVSGGHTTATLGALTHSLPGIIIPSGGETVDNAERLVRAGCVLSVAADAVSTTVSPQLIDTLLDSPAIRSSVQGIGSAFARDAGFSCAANLVEECLAARSLYLD
ncbi:MAG TPA: nucleotide disphospho-sugar-binding domain-containing protein [Gemmatimonadaceae bacterium]